MEHIINGEPVDDKTHGNAISTEVMRLKSTQVDNFVSKSKNEEKTKPKLFKTHGKKLVDAP